MQDQHALAPQILYHLYDPAQAVLLLPASTKQYAQLCSAAVNNLVAAQTRPRHCWCAGDQHLERLNVSSNSIGDDGTLQLAQMLKAIPHASKAAFGLSASSTSS